MRTIETFDDYVNGLSEALDWRGERAGGELEHVARGKDATYRIYKDGGTYHLEADGAAKCKGTLAVCKGFAEDLEKRIALHEGEIVLRPAGDDGLGNQLYVAKGVKGYFVMMDGEPWHCADDVNFEPEKKYTGKYRIEEGAPARVDEARYTYEPTNFYAARTWSVGMATDADRAAYKKGYDRAQKLLADLVATLEGLPRVDQFEDIPDAIKELRLVRERFS